MKQSRKLYKFHILSLKLSPWHIYSEFMTVSFVNNSLSRDRIVDLEKSKYFVIAEKNIQGCCLYYIHHTNVS